MRVLVLGGSWFVGRVLVAEAVERGHDVRCSTEACHEARCRRQFDVYTGTES